jgi:hypothetical protein
MTATGQRKWRVTVQRIAPVTYTDEFDNLDAALEYACEKRKMLHYRVTVEGPNGVVMDEEELARCCALANQK